MPGEFPSKASHEREKLPNLPRLWLRWRKGDLKNHQVLHDGEADRKKHEQDIQNYCRFNDCLSFERLLLSGGTEAQYNIIDHNVLSQKTVNNKQK